MIKIQTQIDYKYEDANYIKVTSLIFIFSISNIKDIKLLNLFFLSFICSQWFTTSFFTLPLGLRCTCIYLIRLSDLPRRPWNLLDIINFHDVIIIR